MTFGDFTRSYRCLSDIHLDAFWSINISTTDLNTYEEYNNLSKLFNFKSQSRLTTGKNEKVLSLHVPATKLIGKKQLI